MYWKILNDLLWFPDEMGKDAWNLIKRLLSRDPENRLGSNGAEEIKQHSFFKSGMPLLLLRLLPSPCRIATQGSSRLTPILPPPPQYSRLEETPRKRYPATNVKSAVDRSNVNDVSTSEDPVDSVVDGLKISQTVQNQFINFSYTNPNDLGPHVRQV